MDQNKNKKCLTFGNQKARHYTSVSHQTLQCLVALQRVIMSIIYAQHISTTGCFTKKCALSGNQTYSETTGCFIKNSALSGNQTLSTSYSETTNLLDLKLWQQGVLISTPCCQSLTSNRLIVSEYEVPNFLGSRECRVFYETPCRNEGNLDEGIVTCL